MYSFVVPVWRQAKRVPIHVTHTQLRVCLVRTLRHGCGPCLAGVCKEKGMRGERTSSTRRK